MEDVYKKYMRDDSRHWIVKYFMFSWLYQNKKFELINSYSSQNYFLNRESTIFKFKIIQDRTYLDIFTQNILKSDDCLTSLHGLYLLPLLPNSSDAEFLQYNAYIQNIISDSMTDYINFTLKNEIIITKPESFFNEIIWDNKSLYIELSISFRFFFEHQNIDPSKSLLNLNSFNNLVYNKICERLKSEKYRKDKEYGTNLNDNCIGDFLPLTNRYFTLINDARNQKTEAHPYDKYGNLRIRISNYELNELINKQKKALQEICNFNFLSQ